MSTFTIVSFFLNLVLIILCLSLVYPKAIQVYREKKKLRENQRDNEIKEFIQRVVREYLEELKND